MLLRIVNLMVVALTIAIFAASIYANASDHGHKGWGHTKIRMVGNSIDAWIAKRALKYLCLNYSLIVTTAFQVKKRIRGLLKEDLCHSQAKSGTDLVSIQKMSVRTKRKVE